MRSVAHEPDPVDHTLGGDDELRGLEVDQGERCPVDCRHHDDPEASRLPGVQKHEECQGHKSSRTQENDRVHTAAVNDLLTVG